MPRCKLLCLDLDGTLLDETGNIPEENIAAVREAVAAGVYVCVATGRAYYQAARFARKLGLSGWTIGANGAIVQRPADGKVLVKETMDDGAVRALVDYGYACGAQPTIFARDKAYLGGWRSILFMHWVPEREEADERKKNLKLVWFKNSWKRVLREEKGETLKVVLFELRNRGREAIAAYLKALPGLDMAFTSGCCFELTKKGVNKASAAAALAAELGVAREETAAMGDSENDLALLEWAGYSVAMGNAPDHIKAAADAVAPTNREAGVAWAIRNLILQG